MLKNFPGVSQTRDPVKKGDGHEEGRKGREGMEERGRNERRGRLNVGKGRKGREWKRKGREGKGREGSCPTFESLPASIWLYKHPPSSPVPGSMASTAGYIFYLHVYGCGCATDAVLYAGKG
jgi:hypothetical protein